MFTNFVVQISLIHNGDGQTSLLVGGWWLARPTPDAIAHDFEPYIFKHLIKMGVFITIQILSYNLTSKKLFLKDQMG